jgi:hypothetical protein
MKSDRLFSALRLSALAGVYDTVFQCKGGEILVLRVDVTRTEPRVTLFGCQAQHPLIDPDMHVRIAYHDGKLLGAALIDSIVQLQLNPPRILWFTDDEVMAMQPCLSTVTAPFAAAVPAHSIVTDPTTVSSLTADCRLEPRLSVPLHVSSHHRPTVSATPNEVEMMDSDSESADALYTFEQY